MRRSLLAGLALALCACLFWSCGGAKKTTFATIGTGGITGVYYPVGGAIAKMLNAKEDVYGVRYTVEATAGSVYNLNAVVNGDMEFGVVQSDRQYQAFKGLAEWKQSGPRSELRSAFALHPEAVTLIAADDTDIKTIQDLKGKRVNIGNPGSGQRQNAIDALELAGLDFEKDIQAEQIKATEAPGLLQDGRIDAFFYTVGHPSGAIQEATAGYRKVRFIPITQLDKLLEKYPYYARTKIPLKLYSGATNEETEVETFGVKATLVTSVKVSEDVVYAVTREVFDDLDAFRKLHPALEGLTRENMLEGLSAPAHPGALKYFREASLMK
jgi:TRAP transporter TAXI family solute receptor